MLIAVMLLLGHGVTAVCVAGAWKAGIRERPQPNAAPSQTGITERSLDYAGVKRTYRLHLPKGFTQGRPLPLVIVLHGMTATGAITERLARFSNVADKQGFVVVYPDGINKVWRYWSDEDPNFIKALIDELVKEKIADPQRVYVCGISNGAYLTNVLACDASDRIAAVAAVAGTMSKMKAEKCQPRRAMPILYVHGTDDPLVGYDGTDKFSKRSETAFQRQLSLSAEEFVQWWAKKNGCDEKPLTEKLPDKANDGTTVERSTWKGSAEVVFYKVIGGGHTWPGGSVQPERLLGKTCRDFDASEVMWEFFSKYRSPRY